MSGELETAALASGGGWLKWKRKHADIPVGTPCANCETPLQGTYCHVCGQLAEDFHRSSWHLLVEAVESLLHLDGRLFHTLPNLIRRPGQLTRDYLAGKRAWQVQPFRMFLVVLLVVLFVGHLASKSAEHGAEAKGGESHAAEGAGAAQAVHAEQEAVAAKTRAEAEAEIMADPTLTESEKAIALSAARGDWASFGQAMGRNSDPDAHAPDGSQVDGSKVKVTSSLANAAQRQHLQDWIQERYNAVKEDPERFALILEIWGHRVAILALPVSALMLSLLFAFNRRYFVFDHLIFSMHSLSFQMLVLTTIFLCSMVVGGWAWWLVLAMPVHLYAHMKGAYQRSALGTVARMGLLFVLTTVTFSLLALLWLYLGFNEMAGH